MTYDIYEEILLSRLEDEITVMERMVTVALKRHSLCGQMDIEVDNSGGV